MKKLIVIPVVLIGSAFASEIKKLSEYEVRRKIQHYAAMREHHASGQYLGISKDLDVELEKIKEKDQSKKSNFDQKDNSKLNLARY